MTKRYKDSPWAFVNDRPDMPGAGRQIGGKTLQVKPGERLAIDDPHHRTKGAKGASVNGLVRKRYRESGRPAGWSEATIEEKMILARGLNARQRRELRRKLEGKGKYAPKPQVATLKDKPMVHQNHGRVDHREVLHEGMRPVCPTDTGSEHYMLHLNEGRGMRKGVCRP